MSKNKYLIISSWAPPLIGGPQSLYNLFSQFPKESFAILTSYYSEIDRKTGLWLPCDYYFIDHQPILNDRKKHIEAVVHHKPVVITLRSRFISLLKTGVKLIAPLKDLYLFYQFLDNIRGFISAGKGVIQQYRPTTLIGISDIGPALLANYWLSRIYKIDLVYFFFDLYKGNNLEFPASWFGRRFEKKMFTQARLIIVTNEGARHYYQERYPLIRDRFVVVHNSVFVENYDHPQTSTAVQPPYTIVFTGHVYWAQEQALFNLISAMERLRDLPIKLELYVPNPYPKLVNTIKGMPNVLMTSAPASQMPAIQGRATLLFLPLAWDTKAPDIIATATPGKFTDYLASGRPMLIHAPTYAYVSQYVRQHKLGLVVDEDNVDLLAWTIRNFLEHPEQGQEYINNALRVFHQNHDAKKNAQKLTELLNMV